MTPRTNTLASLTTVSTAFSGHWFQVPKDARENRSVVYNKTAGTGTVKIEGRNTPTDPSVQTTLVQGGQLIQWFPQMRVTCADGAGLTCTVTIDTPCKDTGA